MFKSPKGQTFHETFREKFVIFILFSLLLFITVQPVQAITDPLSVTNNRFGIHVLEYDDLEPASKLVNSQGGQWGYITLVIRQNDLSKDKWQQIFDKCRELKLIPIVRLATIPINDYWAKPQTEHIQTWVGFLNSLNWVVQNRYVILFNEPNHQKEWGGEISPSEYSNIVKDFHTALKNTSSDYFILPAGLDTAAPNSPITMMATEYWRQMYLSNPDIFKLFDGWNSHSYPNPNFSGPVNGTGFGSLKSYQAEINYLTRFGLNPDMPVFITETGWTHQDGKVLGASTNPSIALSDFYQTAFKTVWNQPNLVAVTPFVLNFPQAPFNQFAWQKPNSQDFYPHYFAVKDLPKNSGQPIQVHDSQLITFSISDQLVDSSNYQLTITFKNTGQSIWNSEQFFLKITGDYPAGLITVSKPENTKTFENQTFTLQMITPEAPAEYHLTFQLQKNLTSFGEKLDKTIKIVPPPNLIIKAKRLFFNNQKAVDYRLLVYDQDQTLTQEFPFTLINKISQPIKAYNLIPNHVYRFVILKPLFLPRQIITNFNPDSTILEFKPLLPLDINQDGKLSFKDLFLWKLFIR